jgi:hypothetical protein
VVQAVSLNQRKSASEAAAKSGCRKKPCERIQIGFTMWESSHRMLTVHLRKTHPEWDDKKVAGEVARKFLHGSL